MKLDPIIAVKNVAKSSEFYQSLLGCKSMHGGKDFDILVNSSGEVLLCLHKWGEHQHPSMMQSQPTNGNGLILYLRTKDLEIIYEHALKMQVRIEQDIHINPNSTKREFSLRDPDNYYLTITEYHTYEG